MSTISQVQAGHESQPPRVVVAGGGTGGHLFPGLAVARTFLQQYPNAEIFFFGSGRPIEQTQVPQHGFSYEILPAQPRPTNPLGWPRFLWANYRSYRRAKAILRDRQIGMVVGLGGYAAAPMARAAGAMGIPVVLLEQNSVPGRANRYLSRWASAVCATFEHSRRYFPPGTRFEMTGNPVRDEILQVNRDHRDPARWSLDAKKRTLLVLGGSQGAHSLNASLAAVADRLAEHRDTWQVLHQTGPDDVDWIRKRYAETGVPAHVAAFFHDMAAVYAMADLAVARAGATSIAEFTCVGLPAVFMPFPHAADDHQTTNAQELVEHAAALLVPDHSDPTQDAPILWQALSPLLADESRRTHMAYAACHLAHPDAAPRVVRIITQLMHLPIS